MRIKLTLFVILSFLCLIGNANADKRYCDEQRYRGEHACRERFQPVTFHESKYMHCISSVERVYNQCLLNVTEAKPTDDTYEVHTSTDTFKGKGTQ